MYDALVIGAGPAGSTAARLLAKAGWSVALIEKTAFPRPKVCGEFISATSQPLLSDPAIADAYLAGAGPEVKRVGMFAGDTVLASAMPPALQSSARWGRAMPRDQFDLILTRAAVDAGAEIWQPWKLSSLQLYPTFSTALIASGNETREIDARVVIAAMGSWERSSLSNSPDRPHTGSDLLAFKAHFRNADLPCDLMPLIAFPGGYGGMVQSGGGRVSISFCVRRDTLQRCRETHSGRTAAEAAFRHIAASCKGVRDALGSAEVDEHWLAAGPIRPGIRPCYVNDIFFVGNLAGEAHPIIAEGISMAMQSAWILCRILEQHRHNLLTGGSAAEAGATYRAEWNKAFTRRVRMAAFFARLALSSKWSVAAHTLVRRVPSLLSFGARLSGKAMQIVG